MEGAAQAVAVLTTVAVALVLLVRRPRHPVSIVLAVFAVGLLWGLFGDAITDSERVGNAMWALANPMVIPLVTVFPDGPRGRLGRRLLAFQAFTIAWTFATGLAGYESGGEATWYFHVDQVLLVAMLVSLLVELGSLVRLFRRSTGVERTRIGLVAGVVAFWFSQVVIFGPLTLAGIDGPEALGPVLESFDVLVIIAGVPLAIGLGLLLDDPGPLARGLNRALSWWLLVCVVAAGALLVADVVTRLADDPEPSAAAVAVPAVLVGLLAGPLRRAVRRPVDALLPRTGPAEAALHGLSERLAETEAPDDIPQAVAATLGEALGAGYVGLEVDGALVGEWGERQTGATVIERKLVHAGRPVGVLRLVAPDEVERSLPALLPHVAVAAEAAHLADELERSHERLLAAREEERARLRADLHDELSPSLAGMRLAAASVRDQLDAGSPDAIPVAARLLGRIEAEAGSSVHTIRRILADLRPLPVDDLGLYAALRERALAFDRPGRFEVAFAAGVDLPPLEPAAEVAAFRVLAEAMSNAARHGGARHCEVRLAHDPAGLVIEVADDGAGLPADGPVGAGLGLRSMRERVEGVGGRLRVEPVEPHGTRVVATIPAGTIGVIEPAGPVEPVELEGAP